MKKSKLIVVALFLILSVFLQTSFGQSDKSQKIDGFLKQFVESNQFGGVILATENGRVIYEKAFGLANADFKIPNQPNTRIGIASITKPMTIVILTLLLEEKKISLTDTLSKYIPDFPNGDKIKIEMLARHRSGIRHRVMPPEMESVAVTSAEFVEKVKQSPLAFEPGTQTLYSSGGFAVLARCLEIASGKSYARLLQDYVFTPAGMTDSVNFEGDAVIERRAQDYYFSPNGLVNVPLKNYSFLVGAGSVYSTAKDIYRFGEAVLDGKYGQEAKARLIGQTTLNASGSTNGHRGYFEIEKNQKYGFVILSNLAGPFDLITKGLREILEGKELTVKPFSIPKIIPNPNKNLTDFLGRYVRKDVGGELIITQKGDYLYSAEIKLYPTKADCFFEFRYYGEVCFNRDESGAVKDINWKSFDVDSIWVRQ
jgi:CubicO group peptidase (beta-lactamase class C family)